jgi:hypothetical protein
MSHFAASPPQSSVFFPKLSALSQKNSREITTLSQEDFSMSEMKTLRSVAQLLNVPYTDVRYAVVTNGIIEPTRISDWYFLCSEEQVEILRRYFAAKTAAKERRQMLKQQRQKKAG